MCAIVQQRLWMRDGAYLRLKTRQPRKLGERAIDRRTRAQNLAAVDFSPIADF